MAESLEFSIGSSKKPLVFISHDTRDGEIAEAFGKLLTSVSAGAVDVFRSSDTSGNNGISYGDDWYNAIMEKLDLATDVVCLFTEQSVNRPWILYEAGVAKGKTNTPVHGLVLGIPLSKISNGPFYQFQNLDDSRDKLKGLVLQLCKRNPDLSPDEKIVEFMVDDFKVKIKDILDTRKKGVEKKGKKETVESVDSNNAKLFEDIKIMFRDISEKLSIVNQNEPNYYKNSRAHKVDIYTNHSFTTVYGDLTDIIATFPDPSDSLKAPASYVDLILLTFSSPFKMIFPEIYDIALKACSAINKENDVAISKYLYALLKLLISEKHKYVFRNADQDVGFPISGGLQMYVQKFIAIHEEIIESKA